jgi:phage-related protein
MSTGDDESKALFLIDTSIKTPPLSREARREIGALLRLLQDGESIGMPRSRPMPSIGPRCHELRVRDGDHNWRVFYRIDPTHILVIYLFAKTTRSTPKRALDLCKQRLRDFDAR